MFVALLMVGWGEDVEVPKMIACDGCKKEVSSSADDCPSCGHPVEDSVDAYVEERELVRKRAEEERKRVEEKAKIIAKTVGLEDYKIIAEAIDEGKLQRRGGKYYAPNQETPYSGWTKAIRDNGTIYGLIQFKDGKGDGPETRWYNNRQKFYERNCKDGKVDGLETAWYPNGQKMCEKTYKDGKMMTVVRWKPNGEKCPVTNVVDGNGVVVIYDDDGTEGYRQTYKDGRPVSD